MDLRRLLHHRALIDENSGDSGQAKLRVSRRVLACWFIDLVGGFTHRSGIPQLISVDQRLGQQVIRVQSLTVLSGNSDHELAAGDVFQHQSLRTDFCVVSHCHGTQHRCTGSDQNAVADRRVALGLRSRGPTQSYVVVHQHVIANFGGFTDDDPSTVVDEEPTSDGGSGMNLDIGEKTSELAERAGRESQGWVLVPHPVGNAVPPDCMDSGIEQGYFQAGARCWILFQGRIQIFLDPEQNRHFFSLHEPSNSQDVIELPMLPAKRVTTNGRPQTMSVRWLRSTLSVLRNVC